MNNHRHRDDEDFGHSDSPVFVPLNRTEVIAILLDANGLMELKEGVEIEFDDIVDSNQQINNIADGTGVKEYKEYKEHEKGLINLLSATTKPTRPFNPDALAKAAKLAMALTEGL